jgi:hypothetical protein
LQLGNLSLPPLSIRHLHAAPPLLQVAVRLIVVRGLRKSKIGIDVDGIAPSAPMMSRSFYGLSVAD